LKKQTSKNKKYNTKLNKFGIKSFVNLLIEEEKELFELKSNGKRIKEKEVYFKL